MLHELSLEHFKCFSALALPLRTMTLLTGVNATGKSTVLQAMVLLHQTVLDSRWGGSLSIDGSVISLGTLGDVVDQIHGRGRFSIGLRGDAFTARWGFGTDASNRRDVAVALADGFLEHDGIRSFLGPGHEGGDSLLPAGLRQSGAGREMVALLENLSYLSAERMGPREVYPLGDPARHRGVGVQGEQAPGLVYWFGEQPVPKPLCLDGPPTLARQVDAWLGHFFPGAGYDLQPVRGANLLTLGLRSRQEEDFHRPQHVGFGISHVFPIIVGVLHASKGQLVIIENPESHLHPQGQAKVGAFLARAAAAGVQLVVETHSDHVLNGVRRAVRDSVLSNDDLMIHFFQPRATAPGDGAAQIVTPTIDRGGNIDSWPEGFFDQIEKDLSYLAGL